MVRVPLEFHSLLACADAKGMAWDREVTRFGSCSQVRGEHGRRPHGGLGEEILEHVIRDLQASLVAQTVKNLSANAGDLGSISGPGRSPGEGYGYPLQYSCLENPHGQRSLVGYSPWGRKESDTAKQLTLSFYQRHIHCPQPWPSLRS